MRLFELKEHTGRVAVSDVDSYVVDGVFFLDFSRPLERRRRWGLTVGLLVPVIHQGEAKGEYVVGVERNDPAFAELRQLWATHFPAPSVKPAVDIDGLKIVADFAAQFPRHA